MKKIIMLNASPKGKQASSYKFLNELKIKIEENQIDSDLETFSYATIIKNKVKCDELFKAISESDVFILAFPLYVDSLSAVTQDFIESYHQFITERQTTKSQELYTIINCGFPEPEHNTVAFEIIQSFAKEVSLTCRYNLSIGMGPMASQMPMKSGIMREIEQHFNAIVEQLKNPTASTDFNRKIEYSSPAFGLLNILKKSLYIYIGSLGWKKQAKKNKVEHLLYAKPYKK